MNNHKHFATNWLPDTIIGIFVVGFFFTANIIFILLTSQLFKTIGSLLFWSQLFSVILLVGLFILHKKAFYPDLKVIGNFSWQEYRSFLYILAGIGMLFTLLSMILNIQEEEFLNDLLKNRSSNDIVAIVISTVIFAPIIEEILFRHFILAIFPFNRGGKWAAYAIVFSALAFCLVHTQYAQTITLISIFISGIVLSLASNHITRISTADVIACLLEWYQSDFILFIFIIVTLA